ncbi:hypothetical protein [Nocardioides ferulae]|uniref:hypothetical protein n=1 Tax=Nocardioides ferulae TaxID=2340821 RepID=UPI0013DDA9EA|nr:hypothetical protein [Nocardioides ferulae]
MASLRQVFPRAVLALLAAVVVAQAAVAWQLAATETELRGVDLGLSGPPVVVQSLADRANALPGRPVVAVPLDADVDPRASVVRGEVTAALAIDLVADGDVLYVASVRDPVLVEALAAEARAVASTFAREVKVVRVRPLANGDVDRLGAAYVSLGWIVAGFLLSLVVSFGWGPVARTGARAAVRITSMAAATAALAAVAATAVQAWGYAGAWPELWLLGWLTMMSSSFLVLAYESLAGIGGIGLAVAVAVLLMTPLATGRDTGLLPRPWPWVTELVPHGAALEAVTDAAYFSRLETRPLLVLVAWVAVSLLTLLVSRRERAEDKVVLPGEDIGLVQQG